MLLNDQSQLCVLTRWTLCHIRTEWERVVHFKGFAVFLNLVYPHCWLMIWLLGTFMSRLTWNTIDIRLGMYKLFLSETLINNSVYTVASNFINLSNLKGGLQPI